ncbi:MAG TPA: diaminopimelate decarboxylase [Trueperaceae bacterium]|nr:diaminopimelate decarboxylase [Trueperaceae bacterium]
MSEHLDDALLTAIADRFGTPTYVYDLDRMGRRLAALQAALPGAVILYAVKANPNGAVLRSLASSGAGAEVITVGELERAARAGVAPERILVGGPAQDPVLVARAAALGAGLVSLDSPGQWRDWSGRETAARFLVRVNPGLDPHTHEHLATGAPDSKFGLAPGPALALARAVAAWGKLAGFHVHAGSMIRDLTVYDAVFDVLEPLYRALPGLSLLDLGGGFAVPDFPLERFAERAGELAGRLGVSLVIEPGRFLTAAAGTLLTRLVRVKEGGPRTHAIADAGMADLLRPALYGARHAVRALGAPGSGTDANVEAVAGAAKGAEASGTPVDVDGPLCENADRLARDAGLAVPAPGTLLAIAEAGAYGFAMASNYASSLRPAEVAVEHGRFRLVRRRERVEDLWRLEDPEPDAGP